jgi:hypothetical protein
MVISLLAHALVILVVSRQLRIGASPFEPLAPVMRPPEGIEIIRYRELLVDQPETIVEEQREEEERPRPQPPEPVGIPVPAAGEEDVGLTNAEKLQPREGDPRLWKDWAGRPLPEYMGDSYALAEGAIRARLSMILDSLALSDEQRRRAMEWLTGEEGHEWGVTEDGILIGGMLIPMNVGALFAEEGPRGRESRAAARDLADIRRSDAIMDIEDVQRERAEAMRERSQAEATRRDSAAAADSAQSADPPPRP